jgi:Flp pilus assembly pilin Flp
VEVDEKRARRKGRKRLAEKRKRTGRKESGPARTEELTWAGDPRSIKKVATLRQLVRQLTPLWDDASGATAVEYALIAMAIAGVIVVAVYALGVKVNNLYLRGSW